MNFQELFRTKFDRLIGCYRSQNAALFFKGFGKLQNQLILSGSDGLINAEPVLSSDGALDIPAIEANKDALAKQLLSLRFCVGIYEQLTAALSAEPELLDSYSGKILIVENNLFTRSYPSSIPAETAEKLYRYFQQETVDVPNSLMPFLDYYCEITLLDTNRYFVTPVCCRENSGLQTVPFFAESGSIPESVLPESKTVSVSGSDFLLQKAQLLENEQPLPVTYTADSRTNPADYGFGAFAGILSEMGIPLGFERISEFNIVPDTPKNEFLPLLQKYWGKDADFRSLRFYSDPNTSHETISLTQGQIISQVVRQSEAALKGSRDYKNIFITAPTGAGKSLLFQLPAIYLAEKYKAVTIVITPLIALMKDQVAQLEDERHVACATFINSTISFEEREKRIEEIKSGQKSIVYLSPELLVSVPLSSITGSRSVGLFVIDEAHIVTSWGKDFRADYWYLGDFLTRLKRSGTLFPVLCLTATAVYGGSEDVVNDTIRSLALENPIIFLGNVRRNNIGFDIRHIDPKSIKTGVEGFKIKKAAQVIASYAEQNEKALVYCPFVSQVDDIYNILDANLRQKVKKYYGTLDKQTRDTAQNSFKAGDCSVMICTKAFGMGVDVKDIRSVYHFAPTGSLSDYVQEIGRAAREDSIEGCASSDFIPTDLHYASTLYDISEMSQFQLRDMLRKIYSLYLKSGRRNLLVSPDAFSYLFSERELDNKVKNGLLLLSKDLEDKFGLPVLQVRPKTTFTKNYVNVPKSVEKKFTEQYGSHALLLKDRTRRILPSKNKRYESDTTVINSGNIYELDMQKIWENHFQNMSLTQFKHLFFNGELFRCGDEKLTPRVHIRAAYRLPFEEMLEKFKGYLVSLSNIFRTRKNQGKVFTAEEFKSDLSEIFGENYEFSKMVLNLFLADLSQNVAFRSNNDRLKFIAARKSPSGEFTYRVMNSGYITMPNYLSQLAAQCVPDENNLYQAFIPFGRNGKRPERISLLSFLELFGLATYQVEGGQNMEVFVRINDPYSLSWCLSAGYENGVLTGIKKHHRNALAVMQDFMEKDYSDEQRWNRIENYFLGNRDQNSD